MSWRFWAQTIIPFGIGASIPWIVLRLAGIL